MTTRSWEKTASSLPLDRTVLWTIRTPKGIYRIHRSVATNLLPAVTTGAEQKQATRVSEAGTASDALPALGVYPIPGHEQQGMSATLTVVGP